MVPNIISGFVLVALGFMVLLAYAQEHEGCVGGRSLKSLKPCGSISSPAM